MAARVVGTTSRLHDHNAVFRLTFNLKSHENLDIVCNSSTLDHIHRILLRYLLWLSALENFNVRWSGPSKKVRIVQCILGCAILTTNPLRLVTEYSTRHTTNTFGQLPSGRTLDPRLSSLLLSGVYSLFSTSI